MALKIRFQHKEGNHNFQLGGMDRRAIREDAARSTIAPYHLPKRALEDDECVEGCKTLALAPNLESRQRSAR